ncbi:MAG: hypothetical protein Q9184_008464, partial [Pyrenodesmia sp. 2 TL-2023]
NLFCIIQGGLDLELRKKCCEEMAKRETPGVAIGGLSGGEDKESYCKNKPRYVMGVGYPEDLVVSVALGADMFDCVWPTRTARFGNAITSAGNLNLRHATFATDFRPIEATCTCPCCRPETPDGGSGLGITRAYIHHVAAKETVGAHLLTMHNVHHLLSLMRRIRAAIVEDRYPAFLRDFFAVRYGDDMEKVPEWAVAALKGVGVDLMAVGEGEEEEGGEGLG